MNQFKTGKLQSVLCPVGRFSDGSPRYRRANFDVLKWGPVSTGLINTYILPRGNYITSGAANDQDEQFGMEFGFFDGTSHIVDTHIGDGKDELFGLHMFGYV